MNTLSKAEPRELQRREVSYVAMPVDISETKDEYVLTADMPGVSRDGIEITLDNSELTITGHRQHAAEQGDLLHRETVEHDYRRSFVLDPVIESAKINAHMDNGVLTLRLPKAEKVKPRRIAVS